MEKLNVNKRASFDYEILEKFKAGIQLTGHETKSIKSGHVDIVAGRAVVRNDEIFILGLNIPSFQPKNAPKDYDPLRTKKLLLTRREINYLFGKIKAGLTLLALSVYTDRGKIKLELGLGKRRKKEDKRELIKKRETEREVRRFEN